MALVLKKLFSGYNELLELSDSNVEGFPLMTSPLPIMGLVVFYIVFIFKWGPALMKNRAPFDLSRTILVYNAVQIFFNIIGVTVCLWWWPKTSIFCTPVGHVKDTEAFVELVLHYLYLWLKIFDIADTIFFVLRKKYKQVTFLHVYHHTTMIMGAWVSFKFFPGAQLYFLGLANTFVHMVMYFYYFLTSWDPAYKESIWWKKHLTQLQIAQHCFIFISFFIPLLNVNCTYPKLLLATFCMQTVVIILLFSDFYIKTYIKKRTHLK